MSKGIFILLQRFFFCYFHIPRWHFGLLCWVINFYIQKVVDACSPRASAWKAFVPFRQRMQRFSGGQTSPSIVWMKVSPRILFLLCGVKWQHMAVCHHWLLFFSSFISPPLKSTHWSSLIFVFNFSHYSFYF